LFPRRCGGASGGKAPKSALSRLTDRG